METYRPEQRQTVRIDDLPRLYVPDREPIFSYGDHDDVVIVSVHDAFSTVSLLHDNTWYWLEESADTELVEIVLCGLEAWVPAGTLVRHETGLAALRIANDIPRLLTEFRWREQ